jgi:hypothetical protein
MDDATTAVADAADENDLEVKTRQWREQCDRDYQRLRNNARALYRAMEQWPTVDSADDWAARYVQAQQDYAAGTFLLQQLGGEMYVAPDETAVLLGLRQALRERSCAAAEAMIADLATISYRNALRVQGWIGNAAYLIEHELFGQESPTATFKHHYGAASGLKVEDTVAQLVRELVPLFDRCNRAVLRNLQALKALRDPATPTVAITTAGQVNVGAAQTNTVQPAAAPAPAPPVPARKAAAQRLRPGGA